MLRERRCTTGADCGPARTKFSRRGTGGTGYFWQVVDLARLALELRLFANGRQAIHAFTWWHQPRLTPAMSWWKEKVGYFRVSRLEVGQSTSLRNGWFGFPLAAWHTCSQPMSQSGYEDHSAMRFGLMRWHHGASRKPGIICSSDSALATILAV